jgi:hypothetical protein
MSNRYDDLALHLKLDDIDLSKDSSKFQCTAVVQGGSLAEDDTFGACLNFGGQNDRFTVNGIAIGGVNPAHTIEAWLKVGTYPEKRCSIVQLGSGSDSHHWLLNAEDADGGMGRKAQLGVWFGKQFTTPIVPVAEWVHIAATYDGSNLVCYFNGHPIDKPVAAAFNLSNPHSKHLELAKRASGSKEGNFQGKMAHVRIYRRALSAAEIREDMGTDRLALAAYRRGHPIDFSLRDKDENYVLYIGDDPRDHHNVNLELRNTSAQAIRFKKEEKAADKALEDNHHFELVFRSGVLSDKTLQKLREKKEEVIVSKNGKEEWDLFCSPREDSHTDTISVYFLYKDTSKLFGANESLVIPLRNISANAGSGARGTRIELKLNQLTYDGETTPITGSRIQHVQIINHLGSRRVPLHVGFVGSNRILNDGSSGNKLFLQLMNVLKSEGDTSVRLTTDSGDLEKSSKFLISFDVQSAKEVAPWSLCTEGKEIDALKVSVTEIHVVDSEGNPVSDAGQWEVKRTDHALGESPVWSIAPKQDIVLRRDDYIQIQISNIQTSLPSGPTNLYLDYKNIPGFWDGQVVCPIEKAPLLFHDVKDKQGKYTGELRVGIGCVKPEAKLEIALGANDADTKPLVIRRDNVNYLTVGIGKGKEEPKASLDVNGEIRANFFRAGEGYSRRLPVGKKPVGTPRGNSLEMVWDEDIKWYRIAKIAAPEPMIAGAEFSLRAQVAGRTFGNVTFRIMSLSGLHPIAKKRAFARLTVLSNNGQALSFSKVRIVVPSNVQHACEGYLEIFVRQSPDGETEVNFSIYDNLNNPAWQPIAWEEQPAALPDPLVAVEYSLEKSLFLVADSTERFSVASNGDVLINSKLGIGTGSPGAKLSILGGLHVGGESDPGEKNLLVGGTATVSEGLHAGAPLPADAAIKAGPACSLLVNGFSFFRGSLQLNDSITLVHPKTNQYAAKIAVEPALIFKTHHGDTWHDSVTVHPPGGTAPTLDVAGNICEKVDSISSPNNDWSDPKGPIMKYFRERLKGRHEGTMLRVISPRWPGHFWQGWVDHNGDIPVIPILWQKNPPHYALQKGVVYAD